MTKTATAKKLNREFFEKNGRAGGLTTKKKYGPKHFMNLGKKGMASRWADKKDKPNEKK